MKIAKIVLDQIEAPCFGVSRSAGAGMIAMVFVANLHGQGLQLEWNQEEGFLERLGMERM